MTYGWDRGLHPGRCRVSSLSNLSLDFSLVGCHPHSHLENCSLLGMSWKDSKNQKTNTYSPAIVAHGRSTWQGGEQSDDAIVLVVGGVVSHGRIAKKVAA